MPEEFVIVYGRRNRRQKAGLRGHLDTQDDAITDQIARIGGRHPEHHLDFAVRLDPLPGAKQHARGAHVFGVSHEPACRANSAKFNGHFHRKPQIHGRKDAPGAAS